MVARKRNSLQEVSRTMFCKAFNQGESFKCAGNSYTMLLPRDITRSCEVVLEKVAAGAKTPPNAHPTFQQVYIILAGAGEITIGDETRHVVAPAVAFIPINTHHQVFNSGSVALEYIYVTVWPEGIPRQESEGGWEKVYADMKDEYAARGYPVEGNAAAASPNPARHETQHENS